MRATTGRGRGRESEHQQQQQEHWQQHWEQQHWEQQHWEQQHWVSRSRAVRQRAVVALRAQGGQRGGPGAGPLRVAGASRGPCEMRGVVIGEVLGSCQRCDVCRGDCQCPSRPLGGGRGWGAAQLGARGGAFEDRGARGSRLCAGLLLRDPAQVWRCGAEFLRHRREASARGGHGGELCSGRARTVHGCTAAARAARVRLQRAAYSWPPGELRARVRRLGRARANGDGQELCGCQVARHREPGGAHARGSRQHRGPAQAAACAVGPVEPGPARDALPQRARLAPNAREPIAARRARARGCAEASA